MDGEEVEEESSSDDSGQEETAKEKASKKNKKNDLRPFVYPYDHRDSISQVSGGELYALYT